MRIAKLLGYAFECIMIGVILSGCGKGRINDVGQQEPTVPPGRTDQAGEVIQGSHIVTDEKKIVIPGISGTYNIIFVNDQHIIVPDGAYAKANSDTVQQRYNFFCNSNGSRSGDAWPELVQEINQLEPDGVILNGDMIDFYSEANLECLMEGLKNIKYPTMYLRADHDLAVWYSDILQQEESYQKHSDAWEMEEIMIQDWDEFLIVGINNNTSQLSESGLQRLKEIWKYGKPVILAMHVPLKSQQDEGLSDASKAVWQDRALIWGNGCYYSPNETTGQFLDMVFDEQNSPVVAVIGAHLHFPYEDQLNDKIDQIVFDASYKGTLGLIKIAGE